MHVIGDIYQDDEALINKRDLRLGLHDYHAQKPFLVDFIKRKRALILDKARKKLDSGHYKGVKSARDIANGYDLLISEVFSFATENIFSSEKAAKTPAQMALIATGGYGAGKLAPFSDIDILFLLADHPKTAQKKTIEYLLRLFWDSGFKIGYSVRVMKDLAQDVKKDLVFCTSMLDSRLLAGNVQLYQKWLKQFQRARKTITKRRFVKAKLVERDIRHELSGRSRYLVEPNIKNGKGGLRDLQTLWWLAQFCYDAKSGEDLLNAGLFHQDEYQKLSDCEAFLWEVRCHLHFLGESQEQLSFHIQPILAQKMGFGDEGGLSGVEHFMKNYFRMAKQAGDLTRILCAMLEDDQAKPKPRLSHFIKKLVSPKKTKNGLGRDFYIEGGRLNIASPNLFLDKPTQMMRFFHIAALYDLNFHPKALNQINNALHLITDDYRQDPINNQIFLDILTSRKNPAHTLRAMNEVGFLGLFILEFGAIVAQMQFNMYHHYTVDEHLLNAIGLCSVIERKGLEQIANAKKILSKIDKEPYHRAALYIAILTHDIAKGQEGDHSTKGAEICEKLALRLTLPPAHASLARWLVEKHLLMSDVAQKRDLADPKTVRDFAREVENIPRLDLLFALTMVDIHAVGPNVLNQWKGQLLTTLYQATLDEIKTPMRVKFSPQRDKITRLSRTRLNDALEGWSQHEKSDYLQLHDADYWVNVDYETQKRHAYLWKEWQKTKSLTLSIEDKAEKSASEIVILSPDHPGLFARLAGACAINGVRIIDARIFTSNNGLAFDSFYVQTEKKEAIKNANHIARLTKTIKNLHQGSMRALDEIDKKEKKTKKHRLSSIFSFEPKIEFDNDASDQYSVIEVECVDHSGLLYQLALTIFNQDLFLSSAHIATYGERAVDVFYVKNNLGQKITDLDKQNTIRVALKNACRAMRTAQ